MTVAAAAYTARRRGGSGGGLGRAWAWELHEDEAELMAGSIEGGA